MGRNLIQSVPVEVKNLRVGSIKEATSALNQNIANITSGLAKPVLEAIGTITNITGITKDAKELVTLSKGADLAPQTAELFFQFFPDSIRDSINPKVTTVPIFLFVNPVAIFHGGVDRSINFNLQFVREQWDPDSGGTSARLKEWNKYNVDVETAVAAIRAFAYPRRQVLLYPVLVEIHLPGTNISALSADSKSDTADKFIGYVSGLSVEYKSFFPDGKPRLAQISLTVTEVTVDLNPATAVDFTSHFKSIDRYNTLQEQTSKFSKLRVAGKRLPKE